MSSYYLSDPHIPLPNFPLIDSRISSPSVIFKKMALWVNTLDTCFVSPKRRGVGGCCLWLELLKEINACSKNRLLNDSFFRLYLMCLYLLSKYIWPLSSGTMSARRGGEEEVIYSSLDLQT